MPQVLLPIKLVNGKRGIQVIFSPMHVVDKDKQTGKHKPVTTFDNDNHNDNHNHTTKAFIDAHVELSGGPLAYKYTLFKIELHSGMHQAKQLLISEHQINGKPLEGELQFHFYNPSLASSQEIALQMAQDQKGSRLFAIVSFMLSSSSSSSLQNKTSKGSSGSGSGSSEQRTADFLLDNIFDLLNLQTTGAELNSELSASSLLELLSISSSEFVSYFGSLTKPPCSESANWIIANKALLLSPLKMDKLMSLLNLKSLDNIRPIQKLNNRQLSFRFEQQTKQQMKVKKSNWNFVETQKCDFKLNSNAVL